MNYIRHLNTFFTVVKKDDRLTASHVSLYIALFQYWNFNRFQNPFPIYRDNIMQLSKLGSKNTYHKCIKELHEAKYIYYHPSASKFLPVKISMVRLDVPEEQASRFKQLDIFNEEKSDSVCPNIDTNPCPKIDTDSVPILTAACPKNDTVPVPKMGHNIKHKHFKRESKQPAQKIFDKNEKLSEAINNLAGVPNLGHGCHPERSEGPPQLTDVETFFQQNNYATTEAQKFFNHYKAIGWKIKGITPIEDWQAAAHKWMLYAKQWGAVENGKSLLSSGRGAGGEVDIQHFYESFLKGEKIFHLILPEHFTQLNLQLNDELMQQAWNERINQLTGTNNFSINQLLQAYLSGNKNNELVVKDKSNLIALAKRITVFKNFQQQKQSGSKSLSP